MSLDKLVELDREALIELILQQAQQTATLQAEIEVLSRSWRKGKSHPPIRAILRSHRRGIRNEICRRSAKSAGMVHRWVIRSMNASLWLNRII